MPKQEFTALGAYIFAGGFTLGVEKHMKILGHLEDGPYGTATAQGRWPKLPIHINPATWPLTQLKGKADFIYSNPPCAAWSAAGVSSASKWETDGRVNCARTSFGLVAKLRPKVWCWESVARAYTLGRPLVDQFTREALDLGYSVTHLLVEAKRLGVPQRRNRFFMVVHNVKLPFGEVSFPVMTAGQALKGVKPGPGAHLPPADRPWVKILKDLEPGQEMRRLFNARFPKLAAKITDGRVIGRPSFQIRRIPFDDVSFTLTGDACLIHPKEDRYITVRESATLCGYPQDFNFVGSLGKQYAQVAQAVMPPVGSWLAGIVKQGLKANVKDTGRVYYVDLRGERGLFQVLGQGRTYPSAVLPPLGKKPPVPPEVKAQMKADAKLARQAAKVAASHEVQPKRPRPAPIPEHVPSLRPRDVIKPLPGETTSGAYIRRLLREGKLDDITIVGQVHANWPGRKISTKDVAWNRGQMKRGVL